MKTKPSPQFVDLFLSLDSLFVMAWSVYLGRLHPHASWEFIGGMAAFMLMGLSPVKRMTDINGFSEYQLVWWVNLTVLVLIAIEIALASLGIIPDSIGLIS